jgi:hypothetical protein
MAAWGGRYEGIQARRNAPEGTRYSNGIDFACDSALGVMEAIPCLQPQVSE